jgi:hypothetical protein
MDWHFYPWVFQREFAGLPIDRYTYFEDRLKNMGDRPGVKKAYESIPNGKRGCGFSA